VRPLRARAALPQPCGPVTRPTYLVSDLHYDGVDADRCGRIVDFLRGLRHEAGHVYLVGDVFDVWLGHKTTVYAPYFPLLRALADLVDAGVRVSLFAGNHDPAPGPFLTERLGVEVHTCGLWATLAGQRAWIEHGDVIDPRGARRRLINRAARHPALHRLAQVLHPDWAWRAARTCSARLGHETKYVGLPEGLVTDFVPARASAGAQVVVLGHYHCAADVRVPHERGHTRLVVLGDWVRHFTYARADGGDLGLFRDRGRPGSAERLGHGDHPPP